jgi:hypothetical protein
MLAIPSDRTLRRPFEQHRWSEKAGFDVSTAMRLVYPSWRTK